jgi:acyl carrier protein
VLGREELDADSHFFRLGGTSMSAMQLCARLTADLGVTIPIRAVFECARLGAFAARVEELGAAAGG